MATVHTTIKNRLYETKYENLDSGRFGHAVGRNSHREMVVITASTEHGYVPS